MPLPIIFLIIAHRFYSANPFPNHRPADSLWEQAVEALGGEDKRNVDFNREDKLAILRDVLDAVNERNEFASKSAGNIRRGRKRLSYVTSWKMWRNG
jgi:hypothetical protein